jgi:hypothetical protein
MIGGALLVLVGSVGTAFQKKRTADAPSSLEQTEASDRQSASQPNMDK